MAGPGEIYLNDDVLMEILVLLRPKPIFKFKLVSRHWRSLLSSPDFLSRHADAHPWEEGWIFAGFIQKAAVHETSSTIMANHCNPLPICNPSGKRRSNLNIPIDVGHFLNSNGGLILCSRNRGTFVTYHIGNPHSGRFVELPRPRIDDSCQSVGLMSAFGNDGSIVYIVFRARKYRYTDVIEFDAYFSNSGKWDRDYLELVATADDFRLSEEPPLVMNSIVHWYTESGDIAVYRPAKNSTHVQLIRVPYLRKDKNICYAVTRGYDNVLWLAVLRRNNLLFYKLPEELDYERTVDISSKEWELVRDVRIVDISKLMKKGLIACVECTLEFLMEMGSEIVALLQQKGKVFLYNMHKESIEKVDYQGCYNKAHRLCPYFRSTNLTPYSLSLFPVN